MGLSALVLIVALLMIFVFNIQPGRANSKTLDALRALGNNPTLGLSAMRAALEFNSPHIDDIRSDLGRSLIGSLAPIYQKLGKDKTNEFIDVTHNAFKDNVALHPMDIRNYLALGQLLQVKAQINNDSASLLEAQKYLLEASKYSPRRQQIIYSLAGVDAQIGQLPEAIKLVEATIADNPKISEGYWRLAYLYVLIGQPDKAHDIINLAKTNNLVFTDQEKQFIDQIIFPPKPATATSKK